MEYYLCIKPGDKNLLHIVKKGHLKQAGFSVYKVLQVLNDEREAFEAVANLVQNFCDKNGRITAEGFKTWIAGEHL